MILTRFNLVQMKMYMITVFDSMNKGNLLMGRFINSDVFYVPHYDTRVKIDKWTSMTAPLTISDLTLSTKDNVVIYTTDSQLTCNSERRQSPSQ